MANPTTNFGWVMPTSTDLVTDLPADFAVFGQGVDTSMADLKGGTTGQILSKTTNADMDFTWINNDQGDITEVTAGTGISGGGTSGAVTITNTMATAIDAKGDLIAGTGADTFSRLAVGTNNQVLTADSTAATGIKWAAVPTTKNFSLLNAGGTALTGAATITVSGISGIDELLIAVMDGSSANASSEIYLRFNGDTGNNYGEFGQYGSTIGGRFSNNATSGIYIAKLGTVATSEMAGFCRVSGGNTSGVKVYTAGGVGDNSGNLAVIGGYWTGSSTISSVSINSSSGNFDKGTIYVYGAA